MRRATGGRRWLVGAAGFLVACSPSDDTAVETQAPETAASERTVEVPQDESQGRAIETERLPYAEVDEKLVYGHFAIPADMIDPLPAVIVVHDRWGLNDEMRSIIERLAAAGYIVLGVDLFDGRTADTPAGARELELAVVEEPDLPAANLAGAYDFIRNTAGAPRIAIVGYGFGGGWSLTAASGMSGDLSAIATYYGQVTDDRERLQQLNVPLLGLFAEGDRVVPPASVEAFEEALKALSKEFEIHRYPSARRGFADRLSDNYDPDISADAWQRTLDFLAAHMPGNGA